MSRRRRGHAQYERAGERNTVRHRLKETGKSGCWGAALQTRRVSAKCVAGGKRRVGGSWEVGSPCSANARKTASNN